MEPLKLNFDNLPEVLSIPQDFQHKKVEVIFWPLERTIFDVKDDIFSFFGCITDFPDRDFQGEPELRLSFE